MREIGSSRRRHTICTRGIMMSRTCRSPTASAPSSIANASASSTPRCCASDNTSISWPRSLRPAAARLRVMRMRQRPLAAVLAAGVVLSFAMRAPILLSFAPFNVRVGDTEPAQHAHFASLHALRVALALVIIAHEVQQTVYHHVGPVRPYVLFLRSRFGAQHSRTDHQVAEHTAIAGGNWRRRKRQNVGGFVAPPIAGVEGTTAPLADQQDR